MRVRPQRFLASTLVLALAGPALAQQTLNLPSAGSRPPAAPPASTGTRFPSAGSLPPAFGSPWHQSSDVRRRLAVAGPPIPWGEINAPLRERYQTQYASPASLAEQEAAMQVRDLFQARDQDGWLTSDQGIPNGGGLSWYGRPELPYRDAELLRRLNLAAGQRQRLRALARRADEEAAALQRTAPGNPDEALRLYQALHQRTVEQAHAILNDTQRRTWQELTGESLFFRPDFASLER